MLIRTVGILRDVVVAVWRHELLYDGIQTGYGRWEGVARRAGGDGGGWAARWRVEARGRRGRRYGRGNGGRRRPRSRKWPVLAGRARPDTGTQLRRRRRAPRDVIRLHFRFVDVLLVVKSPLFSQLIDLFHKQAKKTALSLDASPAER